MPLTNVAEVLEQLAHGGLPERPELSRATAALISSYRTALAHGTLDQGPLFHALGLLHHAMGGASPTFTERGRAHALRLAGDIRRMALVDGRSPERPGLARGHPAAEAGTRADDRRAARPSP